ncbi:iron-containing alcohol dehydrogenase [Peptoniphilus sp. AGMB00490]|uniref:Iron-containing alcohol dehydrogenase n=1 Tax=Peptoniphilus faecalis TaxID=2731255 RepID=A0A848RHQ3_9FIRM|nr:1-propanol dehydrogenase PduQ [Peptoniphilus faecalis]NMW85311.1 iron-containing alcohol dehydrogenase [Peptoniphilus faecalis]
MTFSVKTKIYNTEDSLNIFEELDYKRVLFITDPFVVESRMIEKITSRLKSETSYEIFSDIKPDPTIELVNSGVKKLLEKDYDLVVAVGGGSAIDATKAIIYKVYEKTGSKKTFVAIPTTAGTGSEVTNFSIVTIGEKKEVLIDDLLLADYAVLVPSFTKSVPNFITADTGMDVLTHAIESLVSNKADRFSKILSKEAIKLVFKNLPIVYEDGLRMKSRKNMLEASTIAGIAFTNAGLGINHSLAHILGGVFHISHGRLNAILLPYIIKYNMEKSENARKELREISKELGLDHEYHLIEKIEELNRKFNIPKNLRELNKIDEKEYFGKIDYMSEVAFKDRCTATNPALVTKINLKNIFRDIY